MRKLLLEVDGQEVEVLAQKIAGTLWFHYNGETHQYTPASQASTGGGAGQSQDPNRLTAPMPGKIIKIHCKQGESVSEGQTLVTMEAMKMEYNLKSVESKVVGKIHCSEQQTVALGELLVELEDSDG